MPKTLRLPLLLLVLSALLFASCKKESDETASTPAPDPCIGKDTIWDYNSNVANHPFTVSSVTGNLRFTVDFSGSTSEQSVSFFQGDLTGDFSLTLGFDDVATFQESSTEYKSITVGFGAASGSPSVGVIQDGSDPLEGYVERFGLQQVTDSDVSEATCTVSRSGSDLMFTVGDASYTITETADLQISILLVIRNDGTSGVSEYITLTDFSITGGGGDVVSDDFSCAETTVDVTP